MQFRRQMNWWSFEGWVAKVKLATLHGKKFVTSYLLDGSKYHDQIWEHNIDAFV